LSSRNSGTTHRFTLKNISNNNTLLNENQPIETLYIKAIFKKTHKEESCKFPSIDYEYISTRFDFDRFHESRIEPSLFHGLWDGCEQNIFFDDAVEDIIVYDKSNTTRASVKDSFNGVFPNPTYVLDKVICAKKTSGQIIIANCDCEKCVKLFDEQLNYSFAKR